MDLFKRIALLLIYINCVASKIQNISPLVNNEIDTARCRSNCILAHLQKHPKSNETCEPIKTKTVRKKISAQNVGQFVIKYQMGHIKHGQISVNIRKNVGMVAKRHVNHLKTNPGKTAIGI